MATLRQVFYCATALAEYGDRLPRVEQFAWRTFAGQLQPLAEQQWAPHAAWHVPAGYAEDVRTLRDQLDGAAAPAPLVVRWLDVWLAERAERTVRLGLVTRKEDQVQPQPAVANLRRRRDQRRILLQPAPGWALLRVSGTTLQDVEADSWRLAAVNNAAELTCAADGRPWRWDDNGSRWEVHIGPPPAPGNPPARQLAAELEHLVAGLNPGPWVVSTLAATGRS
jgi:hypothetical protein